MTCIVGIATGDKVYIGGDSITSDGYSRNVTARRKVFRSGELLIGTCGSIRASNLLQQSLTIRALEEGESAEHFLVTGVIEAMRTLLKTGGVSKIENNVEQGEDMLIGFRGRLFSVANDFQVDTYTDGIAAVGAGEAYARAAVLALSDLPPEARVRRALEISAELCALVSPPFFIEVLG